jgi:hypothetical protein
MTSNNIVNNSSSQKDEFINSLRNLVDVNMKAQTVIPTYEGLKIKLRSIIDTAKTVYRNLANVLPDFNCHIAAGKLISTMYLKIHEMMIESKNAHIKDYIVKEKRILKIRKIALKTERNCVKCLFALYDSIQSTAVLIIPNYEKILALQNQLENMYNLRPRTAIYYGEEDGNFEDPKDDDYNPSDDEDDEEFDFDEDDNNSEYNPSDDEEDGDDEFDFDEDDEEDEDDDSDSDYDYEDEDEYSTEDADFMNEYNNDPEYLLEEEDEEEVLIFDEDDDSEYTPSETDEDEDEEEFDFDEEDDNDSEYTPSEADEDEDEEEFDFDEEDDNDSDYTPSETDENEDDEEFDFDEEDEDEDDNDYDYEDEEENREADRQFISDYLNDPDYNPDEDEDEEDELEYDFSYLNKTVDDNGNIVLKAGIADDNDEEDPDYDPSEDEDDEDDEDEEEYFKYNSNDNILNICKRRFENGNVVFRWVKMTKEQAEKKYDEDYVCDEN